MTSENNGAERNPNADGTEDGNNAAAGGRASITNSLLGEEIMASNHPEEASPDEVDAAIRATLSDITERDEFRSSSEDASLSEAREQTPLPPQGLHTPPLPPLGKAMADTKRPSPVPEARSAHQPASQSALPPRPPTIADHNRFQSTGDYSYLSALTEASYEDKSPKEASRRKSGVSRNRTVSWDQKLFDNPKIRFPATSGGAPASAGIYQPVLNEDKGQQSPPPVNSEASGVSSRDTVTIKNHRRKKTLDLADLKADNPLETEAETAIIAAIEEESRMEENRRRADSGSFVMPHVPDEGLDMLEVESTLSKKQHASSSVHSTQSNGSVKSRMSSSGAVKNRHRRNKSTMPTEAVALDQSDTLENTLFGLANTMRKIHTETSELADEKELKRNHRRLPSRDIGHPAAILEDTPVNNADALIHNANQLLRRNIPKDGPNVEGISVDETEMPPNKQTQEQKPKPIWNVFDTKPDPKKTDGDHLDQVEEVSSESDADVSLIVESGDDNDGVDGSNDEYSQSSTDEMEAVAVDIEQGIDVLEGTDDTTKSPASGLGSRKKGKSKLKRFGRKRGVMTRMTGAFAEFLLFLRPKRASIALFCRIVLFYLLVPLVSVAAILFYFAENPLLSRNGASVSWLLLFIARQVVMFALSQAMSLFIIDFLSLRTRLAVRVFGPTISLLIVQSKGFPFILTAWSICDFIFLSGSHALANHWLWWQDVIAMCNANNPSGGIPSSSTNYRILGSCLGAGIAISIKRFWVGLYLGRRTYAHYGDQLAKVIENMILISEVASLGRDFEIMGIQNQFDSLKQAKTLLEWNYDAHSVDENSEGPPGDHRPRTMSTGNMERVIEEGRRNKFTGTLLPSQRIKVAQLLDHWEEPETIKTRATGASINAILQFRQALTFMDNSYPFSLAFGLAENREACIESSQKVYERLMLHSPDKDQLPFETIAVVAVSKNGKLDQKKMKNLIRIFRPNREGNLTMLDFVRSCDTVYKSLRVLRASIANSGQIDQALESLINVAFFTILVCIILAANGFNPLALFLSFSSILLAFAFAIGSASSKYFEGILFILVRRPYDIGDRVAIADPTSVTDINGTRTWFVQNVSLFTTTVRFSGTNEVATLANGSLASSRIINAARSPKAVVHIYLKFGVDVPYSRVQVFKKTIEGFVKARPREWIALARFRSTRVEADLGYIEYALDLQHRESWQNYAVILMSKADLASFCLEVSKQLDMRYRAPSLPVDLNLRRSDNSELDGTGNESSLLDDGLEQPGSPVHSAASPDVRAISALFERVRD